MVAGAALQKFGADLEKHQQLILRASSILIEIYMAESTILRAEKISKSNSEENAAVSIKFAKLQLFDSVEVIKKNAIAGIISFTEGDEQRMMLSGLRRFTRYNDFPNVVQLKTEVAEFLIKENKYTF